MDQKSKFYMCEDCKSIVELVEGENAPIECCGGRLKEVNAKLFIIGWRKDLSSLCLLQ